MTQDAQIAEKIGKWLSNSGLPLEIRTRREFRDAGLGSRHSQKYTDVESGDVRETDVVAWAQDGTAPAEQITVYFVVECKASPNPWVVIDTSDAIAYQRSLLDLGISGGRAREIEDGLRFKIGDISVVDHSTASGDILRQFSGEKNNRDDAYAALMSVMKAAYAFAHMNEDAEGYTFSMPVLVVGSPLYIAKPRRDGSFNVEVCDMATLRYEVHTPKRIVSLVRIATEGGLKRLAQHCFEQANALHKGVRTLRAAKAAGVSSRPNRADS